MKTYKMLAGAQCDEYLIEIARSGTATARAIQLRGEIEGGLGRWSEDTPPQLEFPLPKEGRETVRYTKSLDAAIGAWARQHREVASKREEERRHDVMVARIRDAMRGHRVECFETNGDLARVHVDGNTMTLSIAAVRQSAFDLPDDGSVTTPVWRAIYFEIQKHREEYPDRVVTTRISDGTIRVQKPAGW